MKGSPPRMPAACPGVCGVWKADAEKVGRVRRGLPAPAALAEQARSVKVLGHPRRLEILHALAIRECCVCEISLILELPVSTVSRHLQLLRAAGWVRSRSRGKLVIYSLGTKTLPPVPGRNGRGIRTARRAPGGR
jgi:ArsR family transcriptional regulator, lead/cadmium/zinc/bismuth-responsive transcriptional repressor